MRGLVTSGLIPGARGVNFFVEHLSRNKRSVGIDLNQRRGPRDPLPAGRRRRHLPHQLPARRARAPAHHLRRSAARVNPRLIYAKGHGQGQKGPDAEPRRLRRLLVLGARRRRRSAHPPGQPLVQQRPAFGDFIGGMFLAGGIAGALYHRERTGEGIEVDVSLLGNAVWVMSPDIVAAMTYGFELPHERRRRHAQPARQHLLLRRRQGHRPDDAAERALLADLRRAPSGARTSSPIRASTPPRSAQQEAAALVEELSALFATRPRAEWAAMPQRLRVHLGAAAVAGRDPRRSAGDRQRLRPASSSIPRTATFRVTASPVQFGNEAADGAPRRAGARRRTPRRCCSSSATRGTRSRS